jgi:hypothetical protein
MSRTTGTYTAPSSSWNPAVEGTAVDETDWNALLDDIEAALTESVYTGGLGSTDNRLVRTDGTDTKKAQGSAATLDDSGNLSGIANVSATGYLDVAEIATPGNPAANTARLYAYDDSGTTKVAFRDSAGTETVIGSGGGGGGDLVSTNNLSDVDSAATSFRNLAEGISSTQGAILYRDGSQWTALAAGSSGQVLQTQGAGANPQWASVSGAGDVTAALAFGADNVLLRADGTGKGVQATGIAVDDSNNVSGLNRLDFADAKGIHDANGNEVLLFGATVSAVNELKATNAATGNKPVLAAQGGDTNIIMQLQGKGTGGVELEGTSTNDNATTGYVGEVISSGVASGSAVAISSATYGTVTSIDLTAGDWDVQAQIAFTGSATGITQFLGGISTSTSVVGNAEDVTQSRFGLDCASYNASTLQVFSIAPCRVSVTVTTTYYLIGRMSFTGGSAGVCGRILARRAR